MDRRVSVVSCDAKAYHRDMRPHTLTLDEMDYIVGSITYRPGWSFEVYETEAQGAWLAITALVDDSTDPGGEAISLRIKSPIPPFKTEAGLLGWLRWRLERIEVHECHEWLRSRKTGFPIWDPHGLGADEPITV